MLADAFDPVTASVSGTRRQTIDMACSVAACLRHYPRESQQQRRGNGGRDDYIGTASDRNIESK